MSLPSSSSSTGYEPDRGQRAAARGLAWGLALLALVSIIPVGFEFAALEPGEGPSRLARWTWLLLWLGSVQSAYAVYLRQLPDWSSVWVVTLVALAQSTLYALLLGLALVTPGERGLVSLLDLTDRVADGTAAGWCFIMVCLSGLFSYWAGRVALRWRASRMRS